MTKLKCYDCGSTMMEQVLSFYPQRGEKEGLVIFRDVPCEQCPKCGRKYFTDEVCRQMDDVLSGRVLPEGTARFAVHSLKGRAA